MGNGPTKREFGPSANAVRGASAAWQLTDEYLNCVLSSVLDDEGLATYQKDETKHLMEVRPRRNQTAHECPASTPWVPCD